MTTFHFYELATGLFTGASFSGPDKFLSLNTPPGFGAFSGVEDWRTVRVVDGALVPHEPAPADDAAAIRALRAQALADTDWLALRAIETGEAIPVAWRDYRQALRDLPSQPGFPASVQWPVPPS